MGAYSATAPYNRPMLDLQQRLSQAGHNEGSAEWVGGRKVCHERPRANDKEVMRGSLGGPNRADEMRLSAISRHR